jgi:hypothetical protein
MNKEFIPYEQALELRELGFDEPCLCRYCIVTKWEEPTGEILLQLSDCELSERNLVKAPLYQQAFRWFRDKHKLCGDVRFYERFRFHYTFFVHDIKYCEQSDTMYIDYESYEEAELACLNKLIEIVKNK